MIRNKLFIILIIWGLVCPRGHLLYLLKEKPIIGTPFTVDMVIPVQDSIPTPIAGSFAECPFDGEMLIFIDKYLVPILEPEDYE